MQACVNIEFEVNLKSVNDSCFPNKLSFKVSMLKVHAICTGCSIFSKYMYISLCVCVYLINLLYIHKYIRTYNTIEHTAPAVQSAFHMVNMRARWHSHTSF